MASREHRAGYPVTCICGERLHTPKAVKFHRCTGEPKKQMNGHDHTRDQEA